MRRVLFLILGSFDHSPTGIGPCGFSQRKMRKDRSALIIIEGEDEIFNRTKSIVGYTRGKYHWIHQRMFMYYWMFGDTPDRGRSKRSWYGWVTGDTRRGRDDRRQVREQKLNNSYGVCGRDAVLDLCLVLFRLSWNRDDLPRGVRKKMGWKGIRVRTELRGRNAFGRFRGLVPLSGK